MPAVTGDRITNPPISIDVASTGQSSSAGEDEHADFQRRNASVRPMSRTIEGDQPIRFEPGRT